ncbi:hypothetical protein OPT61_g1905 [Boeremia exigua]|uniref:Uncharacterized protein n=1 Tax=Boeremia exigua TaxID=749465 RepID=A0ACC2INI2_9PLEO|nr:hypothetical protein OPT61_g1905 [Boeremia exigua]
MRQNIYGTVFGCPVKGALGMVWSLTALRTGCCAHRIRSGGFAHRIRKWKRPAEARGMKGGYAGLADPDPRDDLQRELCCF